MGSNERPATNASGTGSAGARGAFLLVIAFVLGVLILQKYDDGGGAPLSDNVSTGGGGATPTSVTQTTRRASVSIVPPTTNRALRPNDQVKVLPANGAGTPGLAGRTGTVLTNNNYNSLAPVDATRVVETTLVEYKPDFEPEARALAQLLLLPASSLRPMEDNPPVPDTRGADIILIIGPDLKLPDTTSTTRR